MGFLRRKSIVPVSNQVRGTSYIDRRVGKSRSDTRRKINCSGQEKNSHDDDREAIKFAKLIVLGHGPLLIRRSNFRSLDGPVQR